MHLDDFLLLGSIRLKPGEEWLSTTIAPQGCVGFSVFLPKGPGRLFSGQWSQPFNPGDVVVADLGGRVAAPPRDDLLLRRFWVQLEHLVPLISFSELRAFRNLSGRERRPKIFPATSSVAAQCHSLINDIPQTLTLAHRARLLAVISMILNHDLGNSTGAKSPASGIAHERVLQVLRSLSASEIHTLSVGELAERFGCSRRHLGRVFHSYFGVSVAALKMELRLVSAGALLRDPEMKITTVAEQCGFNHLGLFNECFKRRFQMSPSQFRKKLLTSSKEAGRAESEEACWLKRHGWCPGNSEPLA